MPLLRFTETHGDNVAVAKVKASLIRAVTIAARSWNMSISAFVKEALVTALSASNHDAVHALLDAMHMPQCRPHEHHADRYRRLTAEAAAEGQAAAVVAAEARESGRPSKFAPMAVTISPDVARAFF